MRYFFEAHTFLRMKHASFGNCGSTIPCTCVGSERFFHIFITIIFVFSKQVLRELENAALATTRHSHCSCSGPVRLIRSKACSGEYRGLLRLCAFTRLRKAIISFVMSVCSFIHTEQFASHWMDFHEIWYLSIFRESVEKIHVSLKSDKNKRVIYMKTSTHFITIFRAFLLRMKNVSEISCREKQKTHFVFIKGFRYKWQSWDNVEKYDTATQVTDDNMAHPHCMLDT